MLFENRTKYLVFNIYSFLIIHWSNGKKYYFRFREKGEGVVAPEAVDLAWCLC